MYNVHKEISWIITLSTPNNSVLQCHICFFTERMSFYNKSIADVIYQLHSKQDTFGIDNTLPLRKYKLYYLKLLKYQIKSNAIHSSSQPSQLTSTTDHHQPQMLKSSHTHRRNRHMSSKQRWWIVRRPRFRNSIADLNSFVCDSWCVTGMRLPFWYPCH